FTHIAKTMSYNPSKILNTDERYIKAGNIANITVFNPLIKSKINHSFIRSKSQNNPFLNKTLDGGIEMTVYRGKIVYKRKK
ncbi:dihydroorotase, partial [candidate division WOR-3 bacterium]|nr:dihydroorotase [candidate division WOR-3 bacterium]